MTQAAKQEDKKIKLRASPNTVNQAEHLRNLKAYNVPFNHTIEDVLDPSYWANEAKKFNIYDRIELRSDDLSFWAEAIVIAKSTNSVKLFLLQSHSLSSDAKSFNDEMQEEYQITFRGVKQHSVIRKADKVVISEGHGTKEEAKKALEEHIKKFGG